MKRRKTKTDPAELERMIEEATVDCYNEDEAFTGILYTLSDNLSFPFKAKVMGESVEVIGIDDEKSSLGRGIIAIVRKGAREYTMGLAELEIELGDTENGKWLEMYGYWLKEC